MKTPSYSVLIAEDHDDSRIALRMALELEGFLVMTTAYCDEALIFAQSMKFDLCILDHWLGDGDVTQLRQNLRRLYPTLRVLFYTGTSYSAEQIKELRGLGDEYLVKPASVDVLVDTVKSLLPAPQAQS